MPDTDFAEKLANYKRGVTAAARTMYGIVHDLDDDGLKQRWTDLTRLEQLVMEHRVSAILQAFEEQR